MGMKRMRKAVSKAWKYVNVYVLTCVPACCQNRGQDGEMKKISVGGSQRPRISSQAKKRAQRDSAHEQGLSPVAADGPMEQGIKILRKMYNELTESIPAQAVAAVLLDIAPIITGAGEGKVGSGKTDKSDKGAKAIKKIMEYSPEDDEEIERDEDETPEEAINKAKEKDPLTTQCLSMQQSEYKALKDLVEEIAKRVAKEKPSKKKTVKKDEVEKILQVIPLDWETRHNGRMCTGALADADGARAMAHSFMVNAQQIEHDFLTARDDFTGAAAHMEEREIAAGVFYDYAVVNLKHHVDGDSQEEYEEAARKFAEYLPAHLATPKGNSQRDAAFCAPCLFAISVSNNHVNFSDAFEAAIQTSKYYRDGRGFRLPAILELRDEILRQIKAYGGDHSGATNHDIAYFTTVDGVEGFPGCNCGSMGGLIKWLSGQEVEDESEEAGGQVTAKIVDRVKDKTEA